jgi:hypothetical protein
VGSDFAPTPADSYVMSRVRLGVAFKPSTWLRFFGEAQDSRVLFYKVNPSNTVSDPFEFRQGYIEAGALEGNGVKVRVGRQDLTFGQGRLVSTGDWSNITKSFDIARGTVTTRLFTMDLVAGSPVLVDPGRMDRHKPGEHFYVDYMTFKKLIPGATVEPYFMAKTALNVKSKDGKLGNADTLYAGFRVAGKAPRGIDYSFEGVREMGAYNNDAVRAWGYAGGAGWMLPWVPGKPHLSSDYLYGSGDSGVKDGRHQSFDYLYGSQQPITSLTGQFAWRNIKDWRAGVDFTPVKRLMVKVDFRDYWLATPADGLYNCGGVRTVFNAKATSPHVGEGVDALATVALFKKTTLGVGVGNLAPGSYLKQSGKTTGFVYPYLTFTRLL